MTTARKRTVNESVLVDLGIVKSIFGGSEGRKKNPRPCFIWDTNGTKVTVLLCTSFSGKEPGDPTVFPEIEKDYLLETIVLIKSKEQSNVPECFSSRNLPNLADGTFLISIQYHLCVWDRKLKKGKSGSLNKDQLLHINNRLIDLAHKRVIKAGKAHADRLSRLNLKLPVIIDSDEYNECYGSNKSGTTASIETGRTHQNEYMNKRTFIQEWLNQGKIK